MVHYKSRRLDRTFAALADATRRTMVAQLARHGAQTAGQLAKPHKMSLPAALKHLTVLSDAGLVTRRKIGRTVHCRLETARLQDATSWLERYAVFWSQRLDALAEVVEGDEP